jgi:protein-L-isoaspartate(D-aspartate) O-methyltransferase
MHPAVERAHEQLVDRLIARGALWSPELIAAFRQTPRHYFLDRVFAWSRRAGTWREFPTMPLRRFSLRLAYSDRALTTRLSAALPGRPPVPLSSSSQPSLMAQMLEDLRLGRGVRTLEVGAGTGYNAALLAHAAGPVVSLDVDGRVVEEARRHLLRFPGRPVEFVAGDGRSGWPAGAPYDRVLVTAASPDLEPAWLGQTAEGGIVQVPVVLAPGLAYLATGTVAGGVFEGSLTRPAYFIALRSEDENGEERMVGPALPDPSGLEEVAAPWKDWAPRRPPPGGLPFIRSLAFLGWLGGLALAYRAWGDEGVLFCVGDLVRGSACWLGAGTWRVTGREGRALGIRLWRTFLDAGGPSPVEFHLSAAAPPTIPAEHGHSALTYRRRGILTEQLWELAEQRERPFGSFS